MYNGNKFGGNGVYFVFNTFVRQSTDSSVIIVKLCKQYIIVNLMAFWLYDYHFRTELFVFGENHLVDLYLGVAGCSY